MSSFNRAMHMGESFNEKIEDQLEIGAAEIVRVRSGSDSLGLNRKVPDAEANQQIQDHDPSTFPDGGIRAWGVVGASFLLVFCTFGNSVVVPKLMCL